jgi:hypothetical protein
MERKEFKLGDTVTVFYQSKPHRIRKVIDVKKKYIELDEPGSRWSLSGSPYPRENYPMSGIEHTTDEHRKAIRLANAKARVRAAVKEDDTLSPEVWFELRDVIRKAQEANKAST